MPSATSRDFYASGLGIPADGYSLDDLKYKYYNNVSRLPVNSGSLADNMIDFLLFKLSLPYGTNYSLDDLLSRYYTTLGIQTEEQYENGVLTTRLNRIVNPNPELSNNGYSAGGAGTGGVSTGGRVAGAGFGGRYGYKKTWTTAPTDNINISFDYGGVSGLPPLSMFNAELPPNTPYTLSAYFKPSATGMTAMRLVPVERDGAGTNTYVNPTGNLTVADDVHTRLSVQKTSEPTTQYLRGSSQAGTGGPVMTLASEIVVSCVLLETGAVLLPYFDGASAGARWLGAPYTSQSQLTTWSA